MSKEPIEVKLGAYILSLFATYFLAFMLALSAFASSVTPRDLVLISGAVAALLVAADLVRLKVGELLWFGEKPGDH